MTRRRGFTLIEVLISLVVLGLVAASIYKMLNTTQRLTRAQAEQVDLQANVRAGSLVVPNELRELNTVLAGLDDQNDIISMGASDITYRASRGLGFLCQTPGSGTELRLLRSTYSGFRPPAATDELYIFVENLADRSDDDAWVRVPTISSVATNASACGAGVTGYTITLPGGNPAAAALPGMAVRTPVRVYERMELRLYVADGRSWLGARSLSAGELNVQPMLGPLATDSGFALTYLNSGGAVTADRKAVRAVRITVRGEAEQFVRRNGSGTLGRPQEALVTQVLLRNSVR